MYFIMIDQEAIIKQQTCSFFDYRSETLTTRIKERKKMSEEEIKGKQIQLMLETTEGIN